MARKNTPESAGSQYATDQLASEYFAAWVRDQMLEASKADPSEQLPLETKADARVIAKNMLKQLEWDTKRELRGQELTNLIGSVRGEPRPSDVAGFYDGFRRACDNSLDWLADELLTIKGEMGGGVDEARTVHASASKQATKPGKHGTLRLWKITYKDLDNPAFGEDSFRKWAYNKEHILDQFGEGQEESWEIVKIEPVLDTGPKRLSKESHRPKAVGSVRRRR